MLKSSNESFELKLLIKSSRKLSITCSTKFMTSSANRFAVIIFTDENGKFTRGTSSNGTNFPLTGIFRISFFRGICQSSWLRKTPVKKLLRKNFHLKSSDPFSFCFLTKGFSQKFSLFPAISSRCHSLCKLFSRNSLRSLDQLLAHLTAAKPTPSTEVSLEPYWNTFLAIEEKRIFDEPGVAKIEKSLLLSDVVCWFAVVMERLAFGSTCWTFKYTLSVLFKAFLRKLLKSVHKTRNFESLWRHRYCRLNS